MPQVINTNMMSLNSQRSLNKSQHSMQTSLERLSSGLRINRAKDDAAGLAISERITSQVRGLDQAVRNANDGISLLQTAEGALGELTNTLQRMRELAIQARNGTYNNSDQTSLNDEFKALRSEMNRITNVTEFNNINLLGTTNSIDFQVGWENGANNIITVSTFDLAAASFGSGGVANLLSGSASFYIGSNQSGASAGSVRNIATSVIDATISVLTTSIDKISSMRADFGAAQNRMESAVRNMENVIENQTAARSRIQDADFARETANLTRTQILQQAGTAMLAQANQLPQNVLSLLQ